MRIPIIAANWKMNKTSGEAVTFVTDLIKRVKDVHNVEIVICPPYTALGSVDHLVAHSNLKMGSQNMFYEESGAYTGEISPKMLWDIGCRYVILGHSERREFFGETDEYVNRKLQKALSYGLIPIVCIGETLQQKNGGKTKDVLKEQLIGCLKGIDDISKVVIAYEPVWAISRGKANVDPPPTETCQEIHKYIRGLIEKQFDKDTAQTIRILYGGSMKPGNAKDLLAQEDIDGGLIGNASLEPESFTAIIRAAIR